MEPPKRVREVIREIAGDLRMNSGMEAMMSRVKEFETPLTAKLAGIGVDPVARLHFERELDQMWAENTLPSRAPEIVIGAGLHAAIYCAARVAQGNPKPLVIESAERAGGTFAVSRQPSFFLNSRNRPGEDLGVPGREEPLNRIPFAPIQPADLGGGEYQANTEMAFAIRATLAMNATVVTGRKVLRCNDSRKVDLGDGTTVEAERAVWATGLGEPKVAPGESFDGKRLMSYQQFLARLDEPFPFEGMKKVAVVGAGDAGRTVVEALIGQGPQRADSVASLDFVDRIYWFGLPSEALYREDWEACNRSRYRGIGRAFPRKGDGGPSGRIVASPKVVNRVALGYNGAYLDGIRYDVVVWCCGYIPAGNGFSNYPTFVTGGREVAREVGRSVYVIGPAAALGFNPPEGTGDVPENTVALFRYGDLTANFAMAIPNLPKKEFRRKTPSD